MLSEGKGQPTLYFDRWIMPAMERAGIAHTDACRYANDGCTETVIDGRSHIAFWQHEMVKTVEPVSYTHLDVYKRQYSSRPQVG